MIRILLLRGTILGSPIFGNSRISAGAGHSKRVEHRIPNLMYRYRPGLILKGQHQVVKEIYKEEARPLLRALLEEFQDMSFAKLALKLGPPSNPKP